jgi:2-polyprenyl-6-methoxyphenol hydroxylase-like FAD-dependent oxidoreductase
MERADVVIVGGGVAGGALGAALAGAGRSVRILERSTRHVDRVRGEWLAPWGVVEAQRLGLYDAMLAAGGHHLRRHAGLGEGIDGSEATASALDLSLPVAGVPGPLCYGHPALCDLLDELACAAGAELLRGVEQLRVTPGQPPELHYRHDGRDVSLRCELVVGADGRSSQVRRQAGIELHADPPHHLMSGLLVDGADGWPDELQTIGTEADRHFLVFPQGKGRVRLYLCFALEQRGRLAGPSGPERFLEAFRLDSLPASAALTNARIAGPCPTYPNQDTWTERPTAPGLVLLGDAAGHNDPIIGQGLSITLRDVRLVRDLLLDDPRAGNGRFEPYVEERAERLRRLRFAARLTSRIFAEFGPEARERRAHAAEAIQRDPSLGLPLFIAFAGPESVPAEVFDPARYRDVIGEYVL